MQKGVGGMMSGALIETEARTILNKGKNEGLNEVKREMARRMLQDEEPTEKIVRYTGLNAVEVEQMAGIQTV